EGEGACAARRLLPCWIIHARRNGAEAAGSEPRRLSLEELVGATGHLGSAHGGRVIAPVRGGRGPRPGTDFTLPGGRQDEEDRARRLGRLVAIELRGSPACSLDGRVQRAPRRGRARKAERLGHASREPRIPLGQRSAVLPYVPGSVNGTASSKGPALLSQE